MTEQFGWGKSFLITIAMLSALAVGAVVVFVMTCSTFTYCGGPL